MTHIIPLSEGVFTIGHDKVFHPFDERKDDLQQKPVGSLLVEIQPFLIQTHGKNILLDTGLGFAQDQSKLQIHQNLHQHKLEPNDIDMVLLSHLHKDHAGGISFTDELGIQSLSFPNAMYYVSRQEFSFAIQKGSPSYIIQDFDLLASSPQVEWLEEKGKIFDFIQYWTDGGHCPYHTSFLIETETGKVFFGGDVAPQLKQLKTKYVAKYDYDGKKAMEMRQHYAHQGHVEDWQFLFYHDVKSPMGRV